MKRSSVLTTLLLTASVLLASCGPGGSVTPELPTPPTTPTPEPTPPTTPTPVPPKDLGPGAFFLPEPGAAIGSGNGTILGTVYVTPTADEVELMRLINEVRTKGTVNGADAITGTCAQNLGPMNALTYNGVTSYAARKHAAYMDAIGTIDESHYENQTEHPAFYGKTPTDRTNRALNELAAYTGVLGTGEVIGYDFTTNDPARTVRGLLNSPAHCAVVMSATNNTVGSHVATFSKRIPGTRNGVTSTYGKATIIAFTR